jgi:transcriptional regulator GlxA family with amidase domain
MEYISVQQLEKAREMLEECPVLSIEAIAENCSFSLRTFYRLFKKHFSISPADYRKMKG